MGGESWPRGRAMGIKDRVLCAEAQNPNPNQNQRQQTLARRALLQILIRQKHETRNSYWDVVCRQVSIEFCI